MYGYLNTVPTLKNKALASVYHYVTDLAATGTSQASYQLWTCLERRWFGLAVNLY